MSFRRSQAISRGNGTSPNRQFQYVEEWTGRPATDHTPEGITFAFLDGFYRVLSDNRELIMALVTAQAYESIQEVNDAVPIRADPR